MQNKTLTILIMSVIAILVAGIVIFFFHPQATTPMPPTEQPPASNVPPAPTPTPSPSSSHNVSLGVPFTAHVGEVFTIKDSNEPVYTTTFTLTGFSQGDILYAISGCPTNPMIKAPCFNYQKTQAQMHIDAPYFIRQVVSSDYKTYATLILETRASN